MADSPEANQELMELLSKLRDEELEHHDTGVRYDGMEAPFYDGKWAGDHTFYRGVTTTPRPLVRKNFRGAPRGKGIVGVLQRPR